ncbi:serine hydrolase [Aquimarina sp. 2201CG14-23]|uniref:serine hydrolase n=1 Tax=Aquimarina mycalae TaxID=3040073 RepID=UPI002477CDF4|nr:serine hydrolase [Aquimarina sp. 2201CG14-23]MDH7448419.1 serine hydrolase [Aquimarina sp. 2201CG14-23]
MTILISSLTSCNGQTNFKEEKTSNSKIEKINEIISLYSDYGGFYGAVGVSHQDTTLYKKGFGFANMEWDIPNETDTKFQIASLTKSFTAMLIIQLVYEEKLDLHKPISAYLSNYPKDKANKITIHQLLTHTSGIPNAKSSEKVSRPKDMANQLANESLSFIPGTNFDYSNSGYTLLGFIIESVTGKPYEKVLKEKVFEPLKMENSGLYKHRPIIKKMSSGYTTWYPDYFDVDKSDESSAYAAGGLYSTVDDMLLWNNALTNQSLVPKKFMDMIFTKHSPDGNGHYGYGWEINKMALGNTSKTIETIGHSGKISGYITSIIRIPQTNSCVILFSNSDYAFLNSINKAILAILNDQTYDLPLKPITRFMDRVIEKKGIDKGITFYKENRNNPAYYVSEDELILSGYHFLKNDKFDEALKIFKLAIETFPNKYNPHHSYADGLMKIGKKREALASYKKSLEINPNNGRAARMIEKLENEMKNNEG